MSYTASVLEPNDYAAYEHLCRRSPQGSVWAAPSFADYLGHEHRLVGVHKGHELVGGATVYLAGGGIPRLVEGSPWQGFIARSDNESENLRIAEVLVDHLLARYDEVTVTLPPEWNDVRAFTWAGFKVHVRYTYRGYLPNIDDYRAMYRNRVTVRGTPVKKTVVYETPEKHSQVDIPLGFRVVELTAEDSTVTALLDWRMRYYWKANPGGSYHTECLDALMNPWAGLPLYNGMVDLVGCNSPKRALFKRGFGLPLAPYYYATTATETPAAFLPVAA